MRSITIDNRVIEYDLKRTSKRNVNIRINPDFTLAVSAPKWVLKAEIESILYSKSSWIIKNLERQKKSQKDKITNVLENGSTILFKGREYNYYYKQSYKNFVNIVDDIIVVYTTRVDDIEYSKGVFLKWLKAMAQMDFEEALKKYKNQMNQKYRIPEYNLKIRAMKSRWGTCAISTKTITLNLYLMFVPQEYIECIALHELTHFLEVHHNDHFYSIMKEYMPNCKQVQRRLNQEYSQISKSI